MKKKTLLTLAATCAVLALQAEFKAGFARLDVTPPLGIPLVGYFNHRVSDGVLDPLCVECVAVSDGTNNALIYCVDDLHLTNPFFAKAFPVITAATGIPRDRIYVHSTHTHTGPADWERSSFSEAENKLVMLYADIRIAKMADAGRFAVPLDGRSGEGIECFHDCWRQDESCSRRKTERDPAQSTAASRSPA